MCRGWRTPLGDPPGRAADADHARRPRGPAHAAGDELLRCIAAAIAGSVRPGDTPARVGGDEFAVPAPRASTAVAVEIGEHVRAAVVHSSALRVSVSVGAAALTTDPRAAMLSADVALYDAKSAGRDCVVTSQQGPAAPDGRE
jgi:diguanylate cyclase (GGDEF)-like protein